MSSTMKNLVRDTYVEDMFWERGASSMFQVEAERWSCNQGRANFLNGVHFTSENVA